MKKILAVLLCGTLFLVAGESIAVEKKKKQYGPKSPVNSVDGVLLPQGKLALIYKQVYMNKDGLYDGDDELDPSPNGPKEKEIFVGNIITRYGVFNNVELKLKVPYKNLSLEREAPATKPEFENSGIGDTTLWARYQILSQRKKDPFFFWAGVGLNMPTGDSEEKTSGKLDPMTMQVGDGSWDPIVELGFTKKIGMLKLNSYLSYTFSTEGDNDYTWGDTFQFDFSAVYCVNEFLSFDLELNNVWKEENEERDAVLYNTGGFQTYITPGVHLMWPGKKHYLAVGVPITVYRDLNGPQLSEDYRIVAKLALVF